MLAIRAPLSSALLNHARRQLALEQRKEFYSRKRAQEALANSAIWRLLCSLAATALLNSLQREPTGWQSGAARFISWRFVRRPSASPASGSIPPSLPFGGTSRRGRRWFIPARKERI